MVARIATLREISEAWTLRDLYDAHDALDLQDALEEKSRAMAKALADKDKNRGRRS